MASSSSNSSSTTAFPTFLTSNIGSLVSVKPENHNYLLWKSQFLPVLHANRLPGFVDGSCPCPSEFLIKPDGNLSKEVNPDYLAWIQQNQNVFCWINATPRESWPMLSVLDLLVKFSLHSNEGFNRCYGLTLSS